MKKYALLLTLMLCLAFVCTAQADEPIRIMALNFPSFDIARSVAGDLAEVSMLLPPGSESHSYEPTPQDIIAIQNADLFLYTGSGSETWVDGIIASMGDQAPALFRLTDSVTMLAEEYTHSMEHHHEGEEHCEEEDHHHGHVELDEHVWTSPKNVMLIAQDLCDALCAIFPENAPVFQQSTKAYLADLEALDAEIEQIVANGQRRQIIIGDRFPFRYFAAAYGLEYDAAFPGCSEDAEPSVRTVISLVDTVREKQIPVIFYIEFSSRRTADILAEETGAKPMLLHSCHNVSADELASGATYLTLMHQNAKALKEALN